MTYIKAIQALADPTRREIFERLRGGEVAVGELAKELPVSRPAVSQHLKVLRQAQLVVGRKEGTRNFYSVDQHGLQELRAYLEDFWGEALDSFKKTVEQRAAQDKKGKGGRHDRPSRTRRSQDHRGRRPN